MKDTQKIFLRVAVPVLVYCLAANVHTAIASETSSNRLAVTPSLISVLDEQQMEAAMANHDFVDGSAIPGREDDGEFHPNSFTPVPEPPTIVSGILVLLPFGACALRIIRRRRMS